MNSMDPTAFPSYSPYPSLMPATGGQTGVQSQCFGFPPIGPSSQGGMPPMDFGMPPPQQQGGEDPNALTGLIGQFMQLFMMLFMGGDMMGLGGGMEDPSLQEPLEEEIPSEETGETEGSEDGTEGSHGSEETSGDPQLESIAGEDANSNSGALAILDVYADQLPTKNGKVTLKELKKFAKSPPGDVPEEAVQAAQTVVDNPELYHLLCLKGGSTPEKGFKVSVLDTDWSTTKIDIDNLESAEDTYSAAKELKKVITPLEELSEGDGFTFDDLKDIALGKVSNSKLKDPAVQAAALMLLSDSDALTELDGNDDEIALTEDLDRFITDNK